MEVIFFGMLLMFLTISCHYLYKIQIKSTQYSLCNLIISVHFVHFQMSWGGMPDVRKVVFYFKTHRYRANILLRIPSGTWFLPENRVCLIIKSHLAVLKLIHTDICIFLPVDFPIKIIWLLYVTADEVTGPNSTLRYTHITNRKSIGLYRCKYSQNNHIWTTASFNMISILNTW